MFLCENGAVSASASHNTWSTIILGFVRWSHPNFSHCRESWKTFPEHTEAKKDIYQRLLLLERCLPVKSKQVWFKFESSQHGPLQLHATFMLIKEGREEGKFFASHCICTYVTYTRPILVPTEWPRTFQNTRYRTTYYGTFESAEKLQSWKDSLTWVVKLIPNRGPEKQLIIW